MHFSIMSFDIPSQLSESTRVRMLKDHWELDPDMHRANSASNDELGYSWHRNWVFFPKLQALHLDIQGLLQNFHRKPLVKDFRFFKACYCRGDIRFNTTCLYLLCHTFCRCCPKMLGQPDSCSKHFPIICGKASANCCTKNFSSIFFQLDCFLYDEEIDIGHLLQMSINVFRTL